MFYDNMRLPSRDDPLRETTTPFITTEQTIQTEGDSDIESDVDDTFQTGIFGLLNPPFGNPVKLSTDYNFDLDNL